MELDSIRSVLLFSVVLMAAASGCNGNRDGDRPWFNVYGQACGNGIPKPGCDFYGDKSKIKMNQDPYYTNNGSILVNQTWSYTDVYGNSKTYTGFGWQSTDGILYDAQGNALNTADSQEASRDLISEVAAQQEATITRAGKAFAAKYALAESTGVEIARTLNDWALIGKDRERTEADAKDLVRRLYGVDRDSVAQALVQAQQGDRSALLSMNAEVAAHWQTSPETSASILQQWYRDEAAMGGLR